MSPGFARRVRPSKKRLICLALALVMLTIGTMVWTLYDARSIERNEATQKASTIAQSVEREVERTANRLDLSLRSVASGLQTPGLASLDPDLQQIILFGRAFAAERLGHVFVTDEVGRIIHDSLSAHPSQTDGLDPDMLRSLQAQPDRGLVVSAPQHRPGESEWSLILARRLEHENGSFAGAVVGILPITSFRTLFELPVIGSHDIVSIASLDGKLIARRPYLEKYSGLDMSKSALFESMARTPVGNFEAVAVVDGVRRLYSYRRIGNLPIIVSVGFSLPEVYAVWGRTTAILGGMLLLLVLLGLALTWAVQRELRRRERAEGEHAEAMARLDAVFINSPDSLVVAKVLPSEGGFLYDAMNPGWERVSGRTAAGCVGISPQDTLPPATAEIVIEAWSKCVRDRHTVSYNLRSGHGGSEVEWEALVAPVFDQSGRVDRLVAVARDVTMRNKFEATFQRAQRMEAVGQLTAGLAHDFNNLLQAILGTLEMIRKQPGLDARGRRYVTLAEGAADRGAKLVHRLLAYSRKQALTPKLLDPARVFAELVPLLASALGATVRVETVIEDGAWAVHADGPQLDDCLFNLAINARDAMPEGGVLTLHASNGCAETATAAGLPAGDYVRFAVTDSGVGMTAETAARALEPFFTTKTVGKGTGLGLSMVQGFARQSGGDVRIESTLGRGTTVALWLPRAAQDAHAEAPPLAVVPAQCRGNGRILVVDDEADVRETLSLILTDAGFDPVIVESGQAALDYLHTGDICDLLVTDQSMPGMTGSTLIGEVARLRPRLPSMLITGFDKVSGLDELQGRVTVLRKPFRAEPFLAQIQALLIAAAKEPTVVPLRLPAAMAAS